MYEKVRLFHLDFITLPHNDTVFTQNLYITIIKPKNNNICLTQTILARHLC